MLGQPVSMLLPEVIGFRLTGKLKEGVTATDLVLTVTQMLRKKGVVGKFVEFFGPGLDQHDARRPRDDRQHGAGIWRDLRLLPGRCRDDQLSHHVRPRGEPHRAGRGLFQGARHVARQRRRPTRCSPTRSNSTSATSCPRWPARSVPKAASRCEGDRRRLRHGAGDANTRSPASSTSAIAVEGADFDLGHGDVVIAAITSCTNTSNPSVLIGAGLLARNAVAKGLKAEAVGQDLAGAGQPGGRRISRQVGPAEGARQARLQPGRLRLHHLHRQFRPAAGGDLEDHQRQGPRSPPPCSPATAISRAASRPTCRRTTSPRRRWSSPMRWPARCRRT